MEDVKYHQILFNYGIKEFFKEPAKPKEIVHKHQKFNLQFLSTGQLFEYFKTNSPQNVCILNLLSDAEDIQQFLDFVKYERNGQNSAKFVVSFSKSLRTNTDINLEDLREKLKPLRVLLPTRSLFQEVENPLKFEPKFTDLFVDFVLSGPSKKLYLLVAPPAFGKTSIIKELQYWDVMQIPKVTTRKKRPEEKSEAISMSPNEFEEMVSAGEILGSHFFQENRQHYGLLRRDVELIAEGKHEAYSFDMCDPLPALKLRDQFPDKVKLVGIFPSLDFAGYGLENRLSQLSHPSTNFQSFEEELEYLKKAKFHVNDTNNRLRNIIKTTQTYCLSIKNFDHVLSGNTIQENVDQMIDIICGDKR